MIRKSMKEDEMVEDIRHRQLIVKLTDMLRHTQDGREVELILVLLSNLLLDKVNLDEKEEMVSLCLHAHQHPAMPRHICPHEQVDVNCLWSLSHNFTALCRVMPQID
jgi:hypothetical protein